jgi:dienelactone hydrolase
VARFARTPTREDVLFNSDGERCAAWLYRAAGADETPCVVLAHGWTGIREQRLGAYAERFAEAGMTALVFDYRHFGASGGEPRQLMDIGRQLADWAAAVRYARGLDGVDPDRVALWGTSFSGGHVVTVAAGDRRIAAVVAQVPFADGLANMLRLGKLHAIQMTREGLRDELRALVGRPPRTIPSVGPPGTLAVMNTPDAEPGFWRLTPEGVEWPNEAPARICLHVSLYRPIRRAAEVRCPILFAIAENDLITPPDLAERAARLAPRGEVRRYPAGHFDVYVGELFERVVADQVEFLSRHLVPEAAPSPRAGAARS